MNRDPPPKTGGGRGGHTTLWIEDDDIAMEHNNLEAERQHKFIIPKTRRPTQAGLEVSRFAEDEATTSPQVVDQPSLIPLQSSLTPELARHHLHSRGSNESPLHLAHEDHLPTSRSHSPRSRGSEAPIALAHTPSRRNKPPFKDFKWEEPRTSPNPKNPILGLPVLCFWTLSTILILILSSALAVSLAIGLSTQPPTPSTTTYTTPTTQGLQGVPSPAPANPSCPSQNGSIITPYDASGSIIRLNNETPQSFHLLCNTYYPQKSALNPHLRDILVVFATDLYACVQLCASYNAGFSDAVGDDVILATGGICVSAALEKISGGFCHLQNATGINDTSGVTGGQGAGGLVDTAVLVGEWEGMDAGNLTVAFGGNLEGP